MEDKWYRIVIDNWAQIVILLGAVGFILQQLFSFWLKKREITFGRIQENRIIEIKAFYLSYQKLELALRNYLYQTEFGAHEKEIFQKIKSRIHESFVDFDYNVLTIKLFLNEEDMEVVDEIRSTLESIRKDIAIWHVQNDSGRPQQGVDKLNEIMDVRFPETLPTLIKKLESSLRKSMQIR